MTSSRPIAAALAGAVLLASNPVLSVHGATPAPAVRTAFARTDLARMKAAARRVTILRDRWGAAFRRVMALRTNSSNNTVYADADGNIACCTMRAT